MKKANYRHTKIVFTVGPATESPEMLEALIRDGVDVCRINMAHATGEQAAEIAARVRTAAERAGREIALMMDVKGPEIRTAKIPEALLLTAGELLDFTTGDAGPEGDVRAVGVNYPGLVEDVQPGTVMLVDSGLLRLRIEEVRGDRVRCRVLTTGSLGSRRHINLPGVHVRLPALTDKDRADVAAGVAAGFDFFALSFVRHGDDVRTLRQTLEDLGSQARIVAKIEDQSALRNLEGIVQEADAVMVARGDLGIEIPYPSLPGVQEKILAMAFKEGKPVIVATQLLESMIASPMPTRAEITDVWHAVRSQADAVMLSGETTVGRYPRECVEVLRNIIREVEPHAIRELNRTIVLKTPKAKMLRAAAVLAAELRGSIIVFTRSGFLAAVLGALRPNGVPIYAFTDVPEVFRQLLLYWGVEPFLMPFSDDCEQTILDAFDYLKRSGWSEPGEQVAVITNVLAREHIVDTIQVREVK